MCGGDREAVGGAKVARRTVSCMATPRQKAEQIIDQFIAYLDLRAKTVYDPRDVKRLEDDNALARARLVDSIVALVEPSVA